MGGYGGLVHSSGGACQSNLMRGDLPRPSGATSSGPARPSIMRAPSRVTADGALEPSIYAGAGNRPAKRPARITAIESGLQIAGPSPAIPTSSPSDPGEVTR